MRAVWIVRRVGKQQQHISNIVGPGVWYSGYTSFINNIWEIIYSYFIAAESKEDDWPSKTQNRLFQCDQRSATTLLIKHIII